MKKLTILISFLFISTTIYSQITEITTDITSDVTWASGTYYIKNNVNVNMGKTLTINAGVVVKFYDNTRLIVYGTLDANGTADSRVYFTSKNDNTIGATVSYSTGSPISGDWNGIYLFGNHDPEGIGLFDYCTIKYGGGTEVQKPANVSNFAGYGHFINSVSFASASYGYRHERFATTIQNSLFTHNFNAGILYDCTDGLNTPNISDNEFSSNGSYAAIFTGSTLPILTNNYGVSNTINAISVKGNVRSSQTWAAASNLPIVIVGSFVSVSSGATLTFSSGTLDFGEEYIIGDGNFTLSSGATLIITSPEGIALGYRYGNLRNANRTFNPGANYIFNASSAQVTGNNFPANANNLTFNNASGVTLTNSVTVSGTLDLTTGTVTTNSNILTLGSSTSNLGTLINNGKINGNFKRWFATSTVADVEFPLEISDESRKVNISYTTAPTTGGTVLAKFVSSNPGTNGLPITEESKTVSECSTTGYWEITAGSGLAGGNYTLDLTADGFAGVTDFTKLRMVKRANSSSDWAFNGTHSATTGSNATPVLHRTGMSGFSNMAAGIAEAAVPVELTSFSASAIGENVVLNWQTATEVNNYGFSLERKSKIENREWKEVAFVEGHGNSNSPKEYSFVDTDKLGGTVQYRLKQIDTDGAFEYSDIVTVELEILKEFKLSQNYPNPFNPSTTIKYEIGKDVFVTLTIYNSLGEVVKTLVNKKQSVGIYEVKFDASSLPSGIYLYKINSGNFSESRKMLLLK